MSSPPDPKPGPSLEARPHSPRIPWSDLGPLAAVLLATLATWAPRLSGPIDLRYDAGVYYVLGTAIAEGRGYRLLNEPGEIEAVQYPPLLPLLVAAHQKVLATSDPVVVGRSLRRTYCLLSVLLALATYGVARRFLAPTPALAATLLSCLSVYTYFLSDLLFAELPFTLASTLLILVSGSSGRFSASVSGLLAVSCSLLRSAGLAVLAAWVGEAILGRRFRQAALRGVVALVPIVLWQAHVRQVVRSAHYKRPAYAYQRAPYQYYNVPYAENAVLLDPFRPELGQAALSDMPLRTLRNARALEPTLGEIVSAPRNFWTIVFLRLVPFLDPTLVRSIALVPLALLGLLVTFGVVVLMRSGERLVPLLVLASLGLVCLTPWPAQFLRYVAPLAPLLAVALVLGARESVRWLGSRGPRLRRAGRIGFGAAAIAVAALQVFTLRENFQRYHTKVRYTDRTGATSTGRLLYHDDSWRQFDTSLEWLEGQARSGEVVATSAPHWAYLRTGLKAVLPPFEVDTARAQQLLDSVPARYLVVDDLAFADVSRRYGAAVAEARPDLWTPVYTGSGSLRIYRRTD